MTDNVTDAITDLTRQLVDFRDARDWAQFHKLKDLILSVSIESGDLLELVQWKDADSIEDLALDPTLDEGKFRTNLEHEVADVFLYLLLVCERANIDIVEAAKNKMNHNHAKYPVSKAHGNAKKYTEL